MQAIETKELGLDRHNNQRLKASAQAGSVTVVWDDRYDPEENHARAAATLMTKLGWNQPKYYGRLVGGANAKGDGYVFVFCKPKGK